MADKVKNRLSFFGRNNKNPDFPSNERQFDHSPSETTQDSAYASSERPSNGGDSTRSDWQSIENHGQIQGISGDRNIAVNRATGHLVDEDTGETVVVTTTTTTTTTTTKGGKKTAQVEVSTHPGGQPATGTIVEAPGDNQHTSRNEQSQSTTTRLTPDPPVEHPAVPYRNPNRKSGDHGDHRLSTPNHSNKHNFSYPSRPDMRGQTAADEYGAGPARQSTYENLKAAAVGLHGVGETLRGTFNDQVDRRLTHNPEKVAAAHARNQAVIDAGNREMAGLLSRRRPEQAPHGVPQGGDSHLSPGYAPQGQQASQVPTENDYRMRPGHGAQGAPAPMDRDSRPVPGQGPRAPAYGAQGAPAPSDRDPRPGPNQGPRAPASGADAQNGLGYAPYRAPDREVRPGANFASRGPASGTDAQNGPGHAPQGAPMPSDRDPRPGPNHAPRAPAPGTEAPNGPGYTPPTAGPRGDDSRPAAGYAPGRLAVPAPDGDPRFATNYRKPSPQPDPISPIQPSNPVEKNDEPRGLRKLLKRKPN